MALDKKRIYPDEIDPIYVNADMPASERDLTSENPDDKALEQTFQIEDFVANEEANKQPKDMSNEELLSHLENINPIKMSDEDLVGELSNQINTKQNIPQTSTEPRNLEPETVNKIDSQFENLDQTQPEQSPFSRLTASIDENKQQEANRLAEAQAERRRNIASQQIQRGAALFGAGKSSTSPDKINELIDKGDQYVGLPVKEYDEQVANQQNDPNSSMSQVMRDYLKKQGFEISDSYSAADISKVAPFLMNDKKLEEAMKKAILQSSTQLEKTSKIEEKKDIRQDKGIQANKELFGQKESGLEKRHGENLGQRQFNQKQLDEQRDFSNLDRVQNQFNKDKIFLQAKEGLQAVDNASALIAMKNPVADQASLRQLARLSGEVGVLTDQDVKAFGGSKAIKTRMEQFLESAKSGTFTDENRRYMQALVDKFKERRNEQVKGRAFELAKQGSKKFNKSPEEVFEFLMPGEAPPRSKEEPKRSPQSVSQSSAPKGAVHSNLLKEYATKHNMSEEQARQFLSSQGYNVQ